MRLGIRAHLGAVVILGVIATFTMLTLGCGNRPAQAPVPGSINTLDAWAFRVVDDSDAAIHQAKIWEQCTEKSPAVAVTIDGRNEKCSLSHPFPMEYKGDLNLAINALNVAKAAGAAYHSSAGGDIQALMTAVNNLSSAVGTLLNHTGGSH